MTKNYSFVFAAIFSLGFTLGMLHVDPPVPSESDNSLSTGESMEAFDYMQYEWQRLRDPETGRIPDGIRKLELEYAAGLPGYAAPFSSENRGSGSQVLSSLTWASRGPWNVGGRTRAFAVDITNPNKLLAGSTSGGMWLSTDGGATWNQTWGQQIMQSVSCIAQDTFPGKTNVWYVGTGEGYGQSASATGAYYLGNGIYKSTDGGLTWNVLPSTASNTPQTFDKNWDIVWNIVTSPIDSATVYAATYGAIYKSTNGGSSWTAVKGNATPSPYFSDVAITSTGVLYATLGEETFGNGPGAQNGLWRSTDGTTWTNITPAGFPTIFGRVKIGISPKDENQVYFWAGTTTGFGTPDTNFQGAVEWNSLWKYKYLSGDGSGAGGQWWDLSPNLPTTGGMFDKQSVQGGYDMVIKVDPADTAIVFLGGTNLYRSDSGFTTPNATAFIGGYQQGATFPTVPLYPNHHPDQHDFVFVPSNPSMAYSTNDGGIFKTVNSFSTTVSWIPLNNGYLNSMFYTVAIDHAASNDSVLVGGAQDNGSWFVNSNNLQASWVTPKGGDGSYCAVADNKTNYYFSSQNGKTMKATLSSSGAVTSFARIDPIGGKKYQFVNPFILDPNDNNIMYLAGGKNLWRNDNLSVIPMAGNSDSIATAWTMFPDTVPTAGATITALAISKVPAHVLYYGTSNRRVYRVDNANTGTPAAVDITGLSFPNGYVSCVAVDPSNSKHVMVAFSNYGVYSIFYTANADSTVPTWTKVAGNLEQSSNGSGNGPSVRWVSIMPVADGVVYLAGTSTGIYATNALNGTSTLWAQQGASTIGNSICDMMDFRTTDGLVAVATHSHGIFTAKITSVNDVTSVKELAQTATGLTSFPNPFTSSATILFSLKDNARVKMDLYDLNGKMIRTLANQDLSAGEHRIELSGENLHSGVYHCVLRSGQTVETRKIICIK